MAPHAFGIAIPTRSKDGRIIEVFYPLLFRDSEPDYAKFLAQHVGHKEGLNRSYKVDGLPSLKEEVLGSQYHWIHKRLESTERELLVVFLDEERAPETVEEVYLKLSLLSHRLARPNDFNLDGIFRILPNVAWTSEGAVALDELQERVLEARLAGKNIEVYAVDKFPKLLNHSSPSQVRVADGSRVRLGAYLGPGTTVMQEGFVNFNAGTAGPNMVEGRISAGVFVDSNSDLGGGCSIMGTLYRDNSTVLSVGQNCVIGANAGAGIALGDNCTIESGLYVTAGTKVELLDQSGKRTGIVKARDLSGQNNLLFRRNSHTGQVEALHSPPTVQLNEALHTNR